MLVNEIPQVVRRVSIPIMVGFFFNTMFNVTDTFFTSRLSIVALAGMTASFPLFFVLISTGVGFSSGMGALMGNELGKKNRIGAAHIHIQGIIILIIISVILATVSHPLLQFGFNLMGLKGEYFGYAYDYTIWLYRFGICLLLTQGINAGLNAQGKTQFFRNFLIGSFLLNVVLDPILIFGLLGAPRLETTGAAVATITVNFVGIFYLSYKLKKSRLWEGIKPVHFIPDGRIFLQIMQQGISAFISLFMITVFFFLVNYFLNLYGLNTIAAFGIGLRLEQLALIPCIGINIATMTIVAQNYGAGNFERVRETYRYATKITLIIIITLCVIIFTLRRVLLGLFTDDQNVIDIGSSYLVFMSFFTIANGLVNVNQGVLQGLKKPHLSMFNGFVRHLIVPFSLMYTATVIFQLPLVWVWWALLISSVVGFIISHIFATYYLKRL